MFTLGVFSTLCLFASGAAADDSKKPYLGVVVDKKTNLVHLVHYSLEKNPETEKTFHATLGLYQGDKEKEGDKKTPEGVYFFQEFRRPPKLLPKFGNLALTLNYPNPWDKLSKKSGSGIWLHSTDEPDRLTKQFDSLGCVVLSNSELEDIAKAVNYRTSAVTIYEDYLAFSSSLPADHTTKMKDIVLGWAQSWAKKDIDSYMDFYHPSYTSGGKNWKQLKVYKNALNQRYEKIDVTITNLFIMPHPKYDVAIFNQKYESRFKNGSVAKKTTGIKILYFAKDQESPKILSEEFRDSQI